MRRRDAVDASSAPTYANGSAKTVCSIFTSDANRAGGARPCCRHVCRCSGGRPRAARARAASAGWISAKPSRQPPGEPGRLTIERLPRGHRRRPRREQPVRRLRDRVGAQRLGDPGHASLEHRLRRLGRDVARRHARAARRQDDAARSGQSSRSAAAICVALVGHDAALDLVASRPRAAPRGARRSRPRARRPRHRRRP